MPRDRPFDPGDGTGAPREKLEAAIVDAARKRRRVIEATQSGTVSEGLLREFHASVMSYYLEVREYRDWEVLEGKWENARLWRRDSGLAHGGVVMIPGRDYKTHHDSIEISETGQKRLSDADWIRGCGAIGNWIERQQPVEKELPGRNAGTETVYEPARLPQDRLIRATVVLDRMVRELGISVEQQSAPRPAAIVGDAPTGEDRVTMKDIELK